MTEEGFFKRLKCYMISYYLENDLQIPIPLLYPHTEKEMGR